MDESDRELIRQLIDENRALREEMRAQRMAPRRSPGSAKTVGQLMELYEATWADADWAPQMRATLKAGLLYFCDRVADETTRADWVHWRDHVRAKETTIRKGPPSVFTRNLEFKRWRQCFRWGMAEGHVVTNPLADVRAARGAKRHRETEPSLPDMEKARQHCDAITWAFLKLGARRGFRAKEARRLEWRQIDLEQGTIELYAWQDKTRKRHLMRIASDVVEALRAIRPDIPGRYVFQSPRTDKPFNATTLWRRVRIAFDQAGLEAAPGDGKVTFHDTRHGFTSRAARKSPLQVAMRLSRHTSLSAAQRYIHVNDEDLETAYERIEEDARIGPKRTQANASEEKSSEQTASPSTRNTERMS